MSLYTVGQVRKAIAVAVTGASAWGAQVVASAPAHITAAEWLGLGGVGIVVLACFGISNDSVPTLPTPPTSSHLSAKP